MNLRRILFVAVLAVVFFCCSSQTWAVSEAAETAGSNSENMISENMNADEISQMLDYGGLDESLSEVDGYFSEHYSGFDFADFWQKIKHGDFDFSFQNFFQMILDMFFGDVKSCFAIFVQLLVLAVISAMLANFDNSFGNTSASLGQKIVYVALIAVVLQAFLLCGKSAVQAINLMSGFLYAIFPIMLTLLAAMGGVSSVGLYHPLLMFSVTAAMNIINFIILPLVYCNAGLTIAGSLNKDFDLGKLSGLFKSVALWSLTLVFTLFSAVVGIIGLGSASMDGLTMKTAKSAVGMFIPVVGRSVSDLLGTLMGTALVLKNCLGIAGVLVIIAICLVPAVKTLIMSWIFKLCGALAEPLGDKQLAAAMTGLGNVLTMLFAVVTACGIFFFFLLAITLAMGNLNMAIG
ncbi:MAG: stage III sporulation protein AE [Bacillota bacterium]